MLYDLYENEKSLQENISHPLYDTVTYSSSVTDCYILSVRGLSSLLLSDVTIRAANVEQIITMIYIPVSANYGVTLVEFDCVLVCIVIHIILSVISSYISFL